MIANRRRSINAQQQQQHRGIGCMKGKGKGLGEVEWERGCVGVGQIYVMTVAGAASA